MQVYAPDSFLYSILSRTQRNSSVRAAARVSFVMQSARDLKLENILIESDGDEADLKLIDFGLAKLIAADAAVKPGQAAVVG